jgi:hypothetical protein
MTMDDNMMVFKLSYKLKSRKKLWAKMFFSFFSTKITIFIRHLIQVQTKEINRSRLTLSGQNILLFYIAIVNKAGMDQNVQTIVWLKCFNVKWNVCFFPIFVKHVISSTSFKWEISVLNKWFVLVISFNLKIK